MVSENLGMNAQNPEAEAVLFVVSAPALSDGAMKRLTAAVTSGVRAPVRLIRLEETGPNLIGALDELRAQGHRSIRVQPFGYPFPESLLAWIPGVLADWRTRGENADTALFVGTDPGRDVDTLAQHAAALLMSDQPVKSVETVRPSLGKPGWNMPPDFEFHMLVCTGPRCAIHGAASFVHMLKEELAAVGISDRCLTTRTGCIYPCNKGPVLALYPHGHWYRLPDVASTRRFVREVLVDGGTADELRFHTARQVRKAEDQALAGPEGVA